MTRSLGLWFFSITGQTIISVLIHDLIMDEATNSTYNQDLDRLGGGNFRFSIRQEPQDVIWKSLRSLKTSIWLDKFRRSKKQLRFNPDKIEQCRHLDHLIWKILYLMSLRLVCSQGILDSQLLFEEQVTAVVKRTFGLLKIFLLSLNQFHSKHVSRKPRFNFFLHKAQISWTPLTDGKIMGFL